jgi:hypothetical protein
MRALLPLLLLGCAEDSFTGGRAPMLCTDAHAVCRVTAGCVLDEQSYVRGRFPGAVRVLLDAPMAPLEWRVRLHFTEMVATGTELLVQLSDPSCSTDPFEGRAHLVDVDPFERAGSDRTLVLDEFRTDTVGEHLLEVFSDAHATWLLVAEPSLVTETPTFEEAP